MDVSGQDRQWDPSKGKAPKRVIVKRSKGQEKNGGEKVCCVGGWVKAILRIA